MVEIIGINKNGRGIPPPQAVPLPLTREAEYVYKFNTDDAIAK